MIKAIIFDIDGVLADSFEANHKFYNKLIKLLGYKKILTKRDFRKHFFKPLKGLLKDTINASDELIEQSIELAKSIKRFKTKIPKDSVKVLKILSRKYKLALVTNRIVLGLKDYFYQSRVNPKLFKTVITVEDVKNHKPDPEALLLVCKRLKIKPSEAIYIGDALSDWVAARASGMNFILYGRENVKGVALKAKNFKNLLTVINNF
jgi:HAD superfamily hydrolase (TIGR01509 family)